MFTGIIQALGTVHQFTRSGRGARLELTVPTALLRRLKKGDSIAVNGCCLTLIAQRQGRMIADLSAETLDLTNLGTLTPGARANLELPLRVGNLISGHLLQGHVEGTGTLLSLDPVDASPRARNGSPAGWRLRLSVPAALSRYLAPKGSVAVDGISLTIARLRATARGASVEIAIIPHTYRQTHLRWLQPGAPLNLETDPLARHLERLLAARPKRPA